MYADIGLFVVADGMGGHLGGSVASSLAVKTLAANSPSTPDELLAAVRHANQVVHHRSTAHPDLAGMGTTLCAIAVVERDDSRVWCLVNVGDSRVYRHQSDELTQLTIDHNFVADMIRAGDLSIEEAADHPRRNTLTRAIGVEPDVSIDDWILDLTGNDRFLLCTDGITNELSDIEIAEILDSEQHPSEIARALVRLANDKGGRDNSTALVVNVVIDPVEVIDSFDDEPENAPAGPAQTDSGPGGTTKRRSWRRSRSR